MPDDFSPGGIAFGPDGTIYVSAEYSLRVLSISAALEQGPTYEIPGPVSGWGGLSQLTMSEGDIFVTSFDIGTGEEPGQVPIPGLFKITQEGTVVTIPNPPAET